MNKEEKPCCEDAEGKPDTGWRPSFSIIVGVGWLISIIIFLGFFAYPTELWEKNVAVILLSTLLAFSLLGGVWALWGIKMMPKEGREMFKTSAFKWRVQVSVILPFIAIIFLIIWFWFIAELYSFSVWQSIAIVLVTLLAIGGILGLIWARWGVKHSKEFKKYENNKKE